MSHSDATTREGIVLSFQANIQFGWIEPTRATQMAIGEHPERYVTGVQTELLGGLQPNDIKPGDRVRFTERGGSVMQLDIVG